MWALFGTDTMFDALKEDLRFLDSLIKTLESLDLEQDEESQSLDTYDKNQLRLAYILRLNSHITFDKLDNAKLDSLLRKSLGKPKLRDLLFKIGRFSPAFSIFEILINQDDFKNMIETCTSQVIQELE